MNSDERKHHNPRWLVLALTLALTGAASSLFLPRLFAGTPDLLDYACAAVFLTVTVAGCFNFWLFVIGFFRAPSPLAPLSSDGRGEQRHLTPASQEHLIRPSATFSPSDAEKEGEAERESDPGITTRTAVVMPIYNEDVERVYLGIRQTRLSVLRAGLAEHCDFFILSDSTDPEIRAREEEMVGRLRKEFAGARLAPVSPLTPALSPLRGEGGSPRERECLAGPTKENHLTPALIRLPKLFTSAGSRSSNRLRPSW